MTTFCEVSDPSERGRYRIIGQSPPMLAVYWWRVNVDVLRAIDDGYAVLRIVFALAVSWLLQVVGLILAGAALSRYPWRSVDGYVGHSAGVQALALISLAALTASVLLLPRTGGTAPLAEPDGPDVAGPRARGTTPLAEPDELAESTRTSPPVRTFGRYDAGSDGAGSNRRR